MSLDAYINALDYDPDTIMVNNSEISEYKAEDGKMDSDGTFTLIRKKQKTVADSTADLAYLSSLSARIFPGAMLLCNKRLVENNPSIVNLNTKPVKFSIDLPGVDTSFEVDSISKASIDTAIGEKVAQWQQANPDGNIVAKVKHSLYEVKNKHKLEVDLGFKLSAVGNSFDIDFNAIEKGDSREWILKFEQIYYNVTLDNFRNPSSIIADSENADSIKKTGVNNENPIGIVNNVSYGRVIYVHFKTKNLEFDINGKINLLFAKEDSLNASQKLTLERVKGEVSAKVFIYGGGTSAFKTIPEISIDSIYKFIEQGYNFCLEQLAAPIGYSVVFMKNGGQDMATVNSSTTYIETTITRHVSSKLRITHAGAFVNVFKITWNEIFYDDDIDQPRIVPMAWERNSKDSLVGQSFDLFFSGNVRDLHIVSKGYTGVIWDKTRTNFSGYVDIKPDMTLRLSGTTLNQRAELL